jgi:hypothetical protein
MQIGKEVIALRIRMRCLSLCGILDLQANGCARYRISLRVTNRAAQRSGLLRLHEQWKPKEEEEDDRGRAAAKQAGGRKLLRNCAETRHTEAGHTDRREPNCNGICLRLDGHSISGPIKPLAKLARAK